MPDHNDAPSAAPRSGFAGVSRKILPPLVARSTSSRVWPSPLMATRRRDDIKPATPCRTGRMSRTRCPAIATRNVRCVSLRLTEHDI